MKSRTVLFLHLLGGNNSAAKVGELQKFLLDCLQPFIPLLVSDLGVRSGSAVPPELLI